jgi:hypothetical protein
MGWDEDCSTDLDSRRREDEWIQQVLQYGSIIVELAT